MVEIAFSENFEGDLSRWRKFYEGGSIELDEKESFVHKFLRMEVILPTGNEAVNLPRFESIAFDVEGGETYTLAVDSKGEGGQTAYLVFLDEKGYRLDNQAYKLSNFSNSGKWYCASAFIKSPDEAKKASVVLMGNKSRCYYDNVIVCKGRVGFSSDYD